MPSRNATTAGGAPGTTACTCSSSSSTSSTVGAGASSGAATRPALASGVKEAGVTPAAYRAVSQSRRPVMLGSSGHLHPDHDAVADGDHGRDHAPIGRREPVERPDALGLGGLIARVHDRPVEERIVAQQQTARSQQPDAPFEVL